MCLSPPRRLSPAASWHEHLSFAMFLIDLARPAVLAELGYLPHLARGREREVVEAFVTRAISGAVRAATG